MTKSVAIFGGSFNPPTVHHKRLAAHLTSVFHQVIVVPCGPRPDKRVTDRISASHRAAMCDIAFGRIPGVTVDLFDLEQSTFTRTHDLDKRYAHLGIVHHVVGTDLVQGGGAGASKIQSEWEHGEALWRDLRWVVVPRAGYPSTQSELPPQYTTLVSYASDEIGSSTDVRDLAYKGQPFTHLLPPEVADYVTRYNLYSGAMPATMTLLSAVVPKAILFVDEINPKAVALAERFRCFEAPESEANRIIVLGGDGTMHRAVRQHWRKRLPFVGVNAGTKGYLLNDSDTALPERLTGDLVAYQNVLLYLEVMNMYGQTTTHYSFNDAWLERESRQTAKFRITVNDRVRTTLLEADAVLIATPAGSTAYARSMGATPLLNGAQSCVIAAACVQSPRNWSAAPVSFGSVVTFEAFSTHRRPVRACFDNDGIDHVLKMTARASRIATVDLAYLPERDMDAKLADDIWPE